LSDAGLAAACMANLVFAKLPKETKKKSLLFPSFLASNSSVSFVSGKLEEEKI